MQTNRENVIKDNHVLWSVVQSRQTDIVPVLVHMDIVSIIG